ncbi:MAG: molybdopterin-dependent oxidoreductase [Sporichthyaceae bacterium]
MGRTRVLAACCGLLAALAGLGAAEGFAAMIGGPSPVVAVGTWAIDTSPAPLREYAIENWGVNNKKVLVGAMLATIAVLGLLAGVLATVHVGAALTFVAAVGLIGVLAAATVRGAMDTMLVRIAPSTLALAVSTGGLSWLLRGLLGRGEEYGDAEPAVTLVEADSAPDTRAVLTERVPAAGPAPTRELPAVMVPGRRPVLPQGLDRRELIRAGGALGAVALAGGAMWQLAGANTDLTTAGLVTLPKPTSPARAVGKADFGIAGLSPYFTPNKDFYRIDTALVIPRLNVDSWSLRIHGMVDRPITLRYEDLIKAPLIERDVTLMCVSNEIGGYYTGNARWLGVRISDVLASVGIKAGADAVLSTSADGWTCGTPLSALTDPGRDSMFAIGMNGEPLPFDHGFPVRMVVPGLYGFVSATKWVTDLRVTRFDEFEAYWTQRGWAAQAPVKTASRIELPQNGVDLRAGAITVAGMAWAQHRGISKVEVNIGEEIREAQLAPWNNIDTWRQWRIRDWEIPAGDQVIVVRATDGTGAIQSAQPAEPVPDGASGYHAIAVPVT